MAPPSIPDHMEIVFKARIHKTKTWHACNIFLKHVRFEKVSGKTRAVMDYLCMCGIMHTVTTNDIAWMELIK
jgi:hypothetical protein